MAQRTVFEEHDFNPDFSDVWDNASKDDEKNLNII